MMTTSDTFTDPYTDDGVLHTVDRRMEAVQPLEGLPDIVLIDRLRFRLEVALQREQARIDEARLTAQRTITKDQEEHLRGIIRSARTGPEADSVHVEAILSLLMITTIEG